MIDPKEILYREGRRASLDLQERAPDMTGTELIAEEIDVPAWDAQKDYTGWKAGCPAADEGQVWILLIPHNAAHYTGRPSGIRSLWGLAHTTDPALAKPWVAPYGTSGVYLAGECCRYEDRVWRNRYEGNEYPPMTPNAEDRWEEVAV